MRASRTYGSMRGEPSNGRPYRNRQIANRFTSIAPRVGRYHVGANLPGRHIDTAPGKGVLADPLAHDVDADLLD